MAGADSCAKRLAHPTRLGLLRTGRGLIATGILRGREPGRQQHYPKRQQQSFHRSPLIEALERQYLEPALKDIVALRVIPLGNGCKLPVFVISRARALQPFALSTAPEGVTFAVSA